MLDGQLLGGIVGLGDRLAARPHAMSPDCPVPPFFLFGHQLRSSRFWSGRNRLIPGQIMVWQTTGAGLSLGHGGLCALSADLLPVGRSASSQRVFSARPAHPHPWLVGSAFWIIHCIPFLLAGLLIGLALMTTVGNEVHKVYAYNLAGSVGGALGVILLLAYVPPNGLVVPMGLLVRPSGMFLMPRAKWGPKWIYGGCVASLGVLLGATYMLGLDRVFPLNIDQYKALVYTQRLVAQRDGRKKSHPLRTTREGWISLQVLPSTRSCH